MWFSINNQKHVLVSWIAWKDDHIEVDKEASLLVFLTELLSIPYQLEKKMRVELWDGGWDWLYDLYYYGIKDPIFANDSRRSFLLRQIRGLNFIIKNLVVLVNIAKVKPTFFVCLSSSFRHALTPHEKIYPKSHYHKHPMFRLVITVFSIYLCTLIYDMNLFFLLSLEKTKTMQTSTPYIWKLGLILNNHKLWKKSSSNMECKLCLQRQNKYVWHSFGLQEPSHSSSEIWTHKMIR